MKNQINHSQDYKEEHEKLLVSYLKEKELKTKYKAILENQYNVSNQKKDSSIYLLKYWKYAAIFIFVVMALFMFNTALHLSPSELAVRYAKTTNTIGNQDVMRKDLSIVEDSRIKANIAFSAQNYQTSIQEYSKLVMLGKADFTDNFYLGISYLKSEFPDTKKAIEHLQIAQNDAHFIQEIDWYLALCYTINKEYIQSSVLLNKIIQNKSFKNKEASILLNKINDDK